MGKSKDKKRKEKNRQKSKQQHAAQATSAKTETTEVSTASESKDLDLKSSDSTISQTTTSPEDSEQTPISEAKSNPETASPPSKKSKQKKSAQSAEATTEQSSAEAPTEEASAEATTEEASAEVTTEQSSAEATKKSKQKKAKNQSSAEAPTEEASAEATTDQVSAEVTAEEALAEVTTEEASAESPKKSKQKKAKKQSSAEATTEDASAEAMTEQSSAEAMTEQASAEAMTEEKGKKKGKGKKGKAAEAADAAPEVVAEGAEAAGETLEGVASDESVVSADGSEPGAEGEAGEEAAGDLEGADVLPPEQLELIIESLLFASDKPLSAGDCRRVIGGKSDKPILAALESLRARREDTGIQLIETAAGWRLQTHPGNHEWVGRLMTGRAMRLSRALMETLAIVAYRQPITRPEIDEIRGVDCGGVLKTLLDRNLVRVLGKAEDVGRPILYGTTPDFLRIFNIKELAELPTLRDFHELGEEEQAKVDSMHPDATPAEQVEAAGPVKAFSFDASQVAEENDELFEEIDDATAAAERAVTEFEQATAPPEPDPAAASES